MGFSVSASTALIFAALFLAFGTLYPAMANGYERVEEADAAKADHNLDQSQTDIKLERIDVQRTGGGDVQELFINVSNTGETALTVDETDLIVDGDYIVWSNGDTGDEVRTSVEGDENTNLWLPNETMEIEYGAQTGIVESEINRFKVVAEHGASVSGDV